MEPEIKVVELFAGVGGFRKGLENASPRFVTIWADQWEPGRKDQFAFRCYSENFKEGPCVAINEDIELAKESVPSGFQLLVGGFPCQDYSVASTNAKGIDGKKGVLWWSIRDIVERRRPEFVLLENVDRLLKSPTSQRGRDFGIILRCMSDLGYSVEWRVINAADYGFVQKRRRTFIFATRKDVAHYNNLETSSVEDRLTRKGFFSREFPVKDDIIPKKTNEFDIGESNYNTLIDVSERFQQPFYNAGAMVGSHVYTREVTPSYDGPISTLRSILEKDVEPRYYQDDDIDKWKEMKGPKKITRINKTTGIDYIYSEGGIPFPDNLDGPGRTMLTSEGTKNRSSHLILDPDTKRYRILTPVECERMNGFPDNWTSCMTERQRYFTMGNALVVGLIEKMGKEIIRMIDERCLQITHILRTRYSRRAS